MAAIVLLENSGLQAAVIEAVRQLKEAQKQLLAQGIVVEPKYQLQVSANVIVSANGVVRTTTRLQPEVSESVEDAFTERSTRTGTQTSTGTKTDTQTGHEEQTSQSRGSDTSTSTRTGQDSGDSTSTATDDGTQTNKQTSTQKATQSDTTNSDQQQLRGSTTVTELEYTI